MNRDPTFSEVWEQLPVVTRHVTAAATISALIVRFCPASILQLYLWERLPLSKPWTLVTSAVSTNDTPMQVVMTIVFLWMNLRALEERSVYIKRGDLIFFLAFTQIICIIIGPYFHLRAFLTIHSSAITYLMAQEDPNSIVQMFGILNILHGLVPWANAAIGFLVAGTGGALAPVVGILIGHLYIYLTELLPRAGGPSLKVPQILARFGSNTTPTATRGGPQPGPKIQHQGGKPSAGFATEFATGSSTESTTGSTTGSAQPEKRFGGHGHKLGS